MEDQKVWLVWRRFFWWYLLVGVYHTRKLAETRCSCADGGNLSIEEQRVVGSWRSRGK